MNLTQVSIKLLFHELEVNVGPPATRGGPDSLYRANLS
jgi:hypothetical protein